MQLGNRDDAAFAEFVRARTPALLRTAYLLTGDQGAAEDLVQTALVKVAGRWTRISSRGDPEPYVRTVLYREHVSRWRHHRVDEVELVVLLVVVGGIDVEPGGPACTATPDGPSHPSAAMSANVTSARFELRRRGCAAFIRGASGRSREARAGVLRDAPRHGGRESARRFRHQRTPGIVAARLLQRSAHRRDHAGDL